VVAADEVDAVRIAQLEADKEGDGLDREESAVDIVTWGELAVNSRTPKIGKYLRTDSLCPDKAHRS
jgi:hypothetical protein